MTSRVPETCQSTQTENNGGDDGSGGTGGVLASHFSSYLTSNLLLGRGGGGAVFLAKQRHSNELIVIKRCYTRAHTGAAAQPHPSAHPGSATSHAKDGHACPCKYLEHAYANDEQSSESACAQSVTAPRRGFGVHNDNELPGALHVYREHDMREESNQEAVVLHSQKHARRADSGEDVQQASQCESAPIKPTNKGNDLDVYSSWDDRAARNAGDDRTKGCQGTVSMWDEVSLLRHVGPHPHIVRFLGSHTSARGVTFMAMELMDSDVAQEMAHRNTDMYREEVVAVVGMSVLRALDHLHRCGVAHRDVKPGNILLKSLGRAEGHVGRRGAMDAHAMEDKEGTPRSQNSSVLPQCSVVRAALGDFSAAHRLVHDTVYHTVKSSSDAAAAAAAVGQVERLGGASSLCGATQEDSRTTFVHASRSHGQGRLSSSSSSRSHAWAQHHDMHSTPQTDSHSHALRGTLHYKAPEQLLGYATMDYAACDVWALGCTLYEMTTGSVAFPGNSALQVQMEMFARLGSSFERFPAQAERPHMLTQLRCSEALRALLTGLLTLDPARRLRTHDAMQHDFFAPLRRAAAGNATHDHHTNHHHRQEDCHFRTEDGCSPEKWSPYTRSHTAQNQPRHHTHTDTAAGKPNTDHVDSHRSYRGHGAGAPQSPWHCMPRCPARRDCPVSYTAHDMPVVLTFVTSLHRPYHLHPRLHKLRFRPMCAPSAMPSSSVHPSSPMSMRGLAADDAGATAHARHTSTRADADGVVCRSRRGSQCRGIGSAHATDARASRVPPDTPKADSSRRRRRYEYETGRRGNNGTSYAHGGPYDDGTTTTTTTTTIAHPDGDGAGGHAVWDRSWVPARCRASPWNGLRTDDDAAAAPHHRVCPHRDTPPLSITTPPPTVTRQLLAARSSSSSSSTNSTPSSASWPAHDTAPPASSSLRRLPDGAAKAAHPPVSHSPPRDEIWSHSTPSAATSRGEDGLLDPRPKPTVTKGMAHDGAISCRVGAGRLPRVGPAEAPARTHSAASQDRVEAPARWGMGHFPHSPRGGGPPTPRGSTASVSLPMALCTPDRTTPPPHTRKVLRFHTASSSSPTSSTAASPACGGSVRRAWAGAVAPPRGIYARVSLFRTPHHDDGRARGGGGGGGGEKGGRGEPGGHDGDRKDDIHGGAHGGGVPLRMPVDTVSRAGSGEAVWSSCCSTPSRTPPFDAARGGQCGVGVRCEGVVGSAESPPPPQKDSLTSPPFPPPPPPPPRPIPLSRVAFFAPNGASSSTMRMSAKPKAMRSANTTSAAAAAAAAAESTRCALVERDVNALLPQDTEAHVADGGEVGVGDSKPAHKLRMTVWTPPPQPTWIATATITPHRRHRGRALGQQATSAPAKVLGNEPVVRHDDDGEHEATTTAAAAAAMAARMGEYFSVPHACGCSATTPKQELNQHRHHHHHHHHHSVARSSWSSPSRPSCGGASVWVASTGGRRGWQRHCTPSVELSTERYSGGHASNNNNMNGGCAVSCVTPSVCLHSSKKRQRVESSE